MKELRPIKESTADYEEMEAQIKKVFKELLYVPLIQELGMRKVENDNDPLLKAIRSGLVSYDSTTRHFTGKFSSAVVRALRKLGAKWEKKSSTFYVKYGFPTEIADAIALSESAFQGKVSRILDKLSQNLPAKISGSIDVSGLFDSTIFRVDRDISKTLKGISVSPPLADSERKKIADEWQGNMRLWISDFTGEEIENLRKDIQKAVFSGSRYDTLLKTIQTSYGVTANKAKFLARQETSLLMAKFKETRYQSAGVTEYKWGCVAGSKLHPVRPSHKILEGKIFSWSNPPITSAPDEPQRRNNPGQDFNCRCFARPVVRFKKE